MDRKKPTDPLSKFGQFLMTNMRDAGIDYYDRLAKKLWKGPPPLQDDLGQLTDVQRAVVRRCVVSSIDHALHDFLFKLHEIADFDNDIQLHVDGQNVAELSDGLAGELFGFEGWMVKYSAYGMMPEEA